MKIKIITTQNKILNGIGIICLTFGTLSILWTTTIASEIWAAITVAIISFGIISLTISWLLFKHVDLNDVEIENLKINSNKAQKEIEEESNIEYLGNWLTLKNGNKYEIHRNQIIELIVEFNAKKVQIDIEHTEQKFYLQSPKEIIKFLINLGP